MATKRFCDRCGKELGAWNIPKISAHCNAVNHYDVVNEEYELCAECLKTFWLWFKRKLPEQIIVYKKRWWQR